MGKLKYKTLNLSQVASRTQLCLIVEKIEDSEEEIRIGSGFSSFNVYSHEYNVKEVIFGEYSKQKIRIYPANLDKIKKTLANTLSSNAIGKRDYRKECLYQYRSYDGLSERDVKKLKRMIIFLTDRCEELNSGSEETKFCLTTKLSIETPANIARVQEIFKKLTE